MRGFNKNLPADRLEPQLQEGLRRRAEIIQPEAHAFWARVTQRLAQTSRGPDESGPL